MARRVCRGPGRPLVMHRAKNLSGPFFQHIGGGVCVKGQGNAIAPGGPLSGIRFSSGAVVDFNDINVCFSEVPQGNLTNGVDITINDTPATITNAVDQGNGCVVYTITESVSDGDRVVFVYDADSGNITGENGNELASGSYPLINPIDTTPPTLQTAEVGNVGGNTLALTFSESIQSADFAVGWSVTADAVPLTMTGNSLYQGGILYLTIVEYVTEGQAVLVSYNSAAGDITDVLGYPTLNDLASITDAVVTNNVTPGPDIERPQITSFQVNGGDAQSTSRTITVDDLKATDNVSVEADMEYMVNTSPGSPPASGDGRWVPYADRLDPVTAPGDGTFTFTAYVKDEANNVSLGVGLSQQVVSIDSIAPSVLDANVDAAGTLLTINLSEDVTGNAGFSLTANGQPKVLSVPGGSGSQITFTCEQVTQGHTLLLSYAAGDVADTFGNPLADFVGQAVTNNSEFETDAPQVTNANIDVTGTLLTINFDDTVTGNIGFTLTANGRAIALSAPGGSGSQITFTTAQVASGETVLLSYTAGDVEDDQGNPLENFTDTTVTNGSTYAAPVVTDANVDAAGTTLTVNLSRIVTGNTTFTLTADAVGKTLSVPGGSGSQITFTCEQIYQGQSCLLSYAAGDVVDGAGVPLADFNDASVTNNSTVEVPPGITLEFHAIVPDGSEIMQGVLVGTSGLSEARAANIWLKDFEDIVKEFGAEPGYRGGRVTGPVGTRVVYANDGASPLPQMPYVIHAPQSTNYVLYSNDISQSPWATTSSEITVDPITAPDGTTNANRFRHTTSSSVSINQETDPNSLIVTASAFVKQHTGDHMRWFVSFFGASVNFGGWIDYTTGQLVGMAAEGGGVLLDHGSEALPNGWYRIWMKGSTNNANEAKIWFYNTTGVNKNRLLNGSSYLWGIQVEPGEELTPVILTTSAPVTRDACALSFDSANHSDTIGAYYAEFDLTGDSDLIDGFLSLADPDAVLSDGTNSATRAAAIGARKIGFVYGDGNMELNVDGAWSTQVAYDGTLLQGILDVFRSAAVMGAIRDLQRWNGDYADLKTKIDELMA